MRAKHRALAPLCIAVVLAGVAGVGLPAGPSVAGAQEAPPPGPDGGLPPGAGLAYPGDPDAVPSPEPAPPIPPGATSPRSPTGPGTESVIGTDGRGQVSDTTAYPSRAIGQLRFQQFGITYICTGFLIDANTVLTSGHCVNSGGHWSTNVTFTPARNGGTAPYGSCGTVEPLWAPQQWLDSEAEGFDYGIIQLDCEIGATVGWFGLDAPVDVDLLGRPLRVRGYPGDKEPGTMWTMDDRVRKSHANLVYYRADTAPGQSGSPVYAVDPPGCAGPCALAIHSYGQHPLTAAHLQNNHGPRIHNTRRAAILDSAAANGGSCAGHVFIDVGDWIDDAVDWLWCNRYMTGYAENRFRPRWNIDRAEVARLLYRIHGSPDVAGLAPQPFSDVPAWIEDAVRWMAHHGYATGYKNGTFRPDLPISRAQVAQMLHRIEGSPAGSPAHEFTDVEPWADAAVSWLVDPANEPPYATGYPGDLFKPDDHITRGETSRMTCRVYSTDPC